jgi:hypothetical protein
MDVGFIRWPLTLSLMTVVGLTAWATLHVVTGPPGRPETKAWIDAVLFWGGFAFLSGVLGTLVGIVQAAQAIEVSGAAIPATLVWGGIKVALLSTVVGAGVLAVAALAWFGLQLGWRLGRDAVAEGSPA